MNKDERDTARVQATNALQKLFDAFDASEAEIVELKRQVAGLTELLDETEGCLQRAIPAWHPMNTAPTDGRLVYALHEDGRVVRAFCQSCEWVNDSPRSQWRSAMDGEIFEGKLKGWVRHESWERVPNGKGHTL
jgi:hypothetical protein